MNRGIINSVVDLTEGGCNACGIVKSVSYQLKLTDRDIPLDSLTSASLVMTIVLAEGWHQEFKVKMMDEYTVFSKEGREVILTEDFNNYAYRGTTVVEINNGINDPVKIFEQTNTILTTVFEMEGYEFILA